MKKHKQRFEHTCETTPGGYVNLDKVLRDIIETIKNPYDPPIPKRKNIPPPLLSRPGV